MRRILVALFVCLLSWTYPAQAAPSLASLDIRPSDVPHAVALRKAWVLTPARVDYIDGQPPGMSAKEGIVAGHAEFYTCHLPAVCVLMTEIFLFKTKAAAHTYYVTPGAGQPHQAPPPDQVVRIPGLGDERIAMSVMGPKFPISNVMFRSGRYYVLVAVQSPTSILPLSKMIQLAGLINGHILHAR
jgi:hypothetical protein